ncbi:MAG: hypothetical protein MJ223_02375 [Mycoplasmoidaceae bacterium]|nr:hypothetical protein [Mycoplasmoidaceae bacterium]
MGVDEAKFNETIESQAKSNLIVSLTLDMLKDEYKLKATEAELKDYQDKLARYLGDAKKAKEYYEKNKEVAEQTVIRDQLLKKIVQEAKKETKKVK